MVASESNPANAGAMKNRKLIGYPYPGSVTGKRLTRNREPVFSRVQFERGNLSCRYDRAGVVAIYRG